MSRVIMALGIIAALALTCGQTVLFGQATGSIVGQVTDSSGAVVPEAVVTVTNERTQNARTTVTAQDGYYRLPLLVPGTYQVSVSKPDFQQVFQNGVQVNVNQTARVDIQLPVGEVSTSVEVSAEPPLVETTFATQGIVIDNRKIVELPLNGRNFAQLGTLMPGVLAPPDSLGGAEGDATPGGFGAVTGGFNVNGQRNQSNNFLLDGATNNDTFNSGFVLRPPPDALQEFKIQTHSYGAEYGRNAGSVVDVATKSGTNDLHGSAWYFNRDNALAARNFFALDKPDLKQHQFGGALGGPIKRDKWFLFGYYEGFLNTEGATNTRVVLTEAERRGDFSQGGAALRDPLTGQPFPGNVIPSGRLDATAQALLDEFVPLPNVGGNRVSRSPDLTDDRHQFGVRSDVNLSERNTLMLRYLFSDRTSKNPLGGSNFSPAGENLESTFQDGMLSDTHVFSPQAINVVRFSVNRIFAEPQTTSGIPSSTFGFQTENTQPTAVGVPFASLSGFFSLGDGQQIFSQRINNAVQISDDFSYSAGRHFLKFGGSVLRENVDIAFLNRPNGDHTFNGAYTTNAAGDFLLGLSRRYRQGGGDPLKEGVGWLYGFYFQDEFRASRRVNVTLGLRYEIPIPFKDKFNRVNAWLPGAKSTVFPEAPAGLVYPGDPGVDRGIIETDYNNFAPRVGIAWDLFGDGRTSLRAGWGMYYDAIPQQGDIFQNILAPPFNPLTQIDFGNDETTPHFADPFYNTEGGLQPRGFPLPVVFIGWNLEEEFETPVVHHYNVSLQRQIGRDMALEVGFVGSRGYNQTGFLEANPGVFAPGQTSRGPRVFPEFSLVRPTHSKFRNWYDSLQVSFNKRFSRGIGLLASYTWSHAIDHVSGLNTGSPPRPQDGVSLSDIKGNAQYDARHRFVLSYTWDLPGLRGQSAPVRYIFGGWQFNGIFQVQSGFWNTAFEPVDVALRFQQNRPNQVCDPNGSAPKDQSEWFTTSCFSRNRLPDDAGKFGTAGRNTILGPGFWLFDAGVFKNIPITEAQRLQFRFEGFNMFNKTNFGSPVTNIGAGNFGAVTSARDSRIIQLGLKYVF